MPVRQYRGWTSVREKIQGIRRVVLNEGETGKVSLRAKGQQGARLQVETRHLHHAANSLGTGPRFPSPLHSAGVEQVHDILGIIQRR